MSPPVGDAARTTVALASTPCLRLHGVEDPERVRVERFVHKVFAKRYGANVQTFAPTLVSLQDCGEIVAAAGFRGAAEAPLFLERYLRSPVDVLLAPHADSTANRGSIVEVAHLAAERAGEGRNLIALIGPYLAAQGFVWAVGTITRELRLLFVRLGIAPLALGVADPAALGSDVVQWGSYYHHSPVVLAADLRQILGRLARSANASKA